MTLPSRPMPKPTAQVEAFVECLGAEGAVRFFLAFGGGELTLANDPKGKGAAEAVVGTEAVARMANHDLIGQRVRVPLARQWLARMLHWQGFSTAEIARTIRATDVSVRRWIKQGNP